MRRFVLTSLMFIMTAFYWELRSQCTVSQLAVQVKSIIPKPNNLGCTIIFNLSWDQEINTGNKYAYVHLWNATDYHTPTFAWPTTGNNVIYNGPSKYPMQSQLVNTVANFVIEKNNTLNPSLGPTYWPDPTVSVSSGVNIKKTQVSPLIQRVIIENISLEFTNCSSPVSLQGDIWASQADNGKNVHCASQGLAFTLNDPLVSGQKNCGVTANSYDVHISTSSIDPIIVNYKVYSDDGDGIFDPGVNNDIPVDEKTNISVSKGDSYDEFGQPYTGCDVPGENYSLWIEVTEVGSEYSTIAYLPNPCFPLPVSFHSFTAVRNKQNVTLNWETAAEQNNRGYYVQRNTRGVWENIAFVFSAADGGNSSALLEYAYKDLNQEKGVSQYRIQQVDMDGRASYSVIRSVRGLEMAAGNLVYPNPSNNGRVSVVFDDQGQKSVVVSDMSGRAVRQYRSAVNNLVIEGLERGMYSIQITDLSSGVSTTEKVIIK